MTLPKELAGQPISLLQNGQVIGKAIAGDGSVTIPATFTDEAPKPGDLKIAVEGDGAQQISVPVEEVPKLPTTLQQTCPERTAPESPMTVSGALGGAPAGSVVEVTFTPPNGSPVVKSVSTAANGGWEASVTPTANQPGTWTVSSRYAGTAQLAEAKSDTCKVTVLEIG